MTTPTTRLWYIEELEKHWGEGVMSFDTRRAAKTAIDQVEALTKELDECRRQSDLQMNSAIKFCQERNAARIERDALAAAADSHKVVRDTLTARLNVLEAAAKLALEFIEHVWRDVSLNDFSDDLRFKAEAALRQAGVQ